MSQITRTCDKRRFINDTHCLVRLARKVVDQEAVTDTFLKTLPAKTDHYQIIYPVPISRIISRLRNSWDHASVRTAAIITPAVCRKSDRQRQ